MTDQPLPELDEHPSLGGKMVSHAVSMTLGCLFTLALLVAGALFGFSFDISVEAAGLLEPESVWRSYSPSSGVIREVLVSAGERVEQGQLLIRLDSFTQESRLEQLRLEAKYKRSDGRTPRSQIEMLEQQISRTEKEIDRMRLFSPAAGMVLSEELEKRVGSFAAEGELLVEIGSPNRWKAVLTVAQADIHEIELDDLVRFRIPAFASLQGLLDEGFFGTVTFIGTEPVNQGTASRGAYQVHASIDLGGIDSQDLARFRRGMAVECQVITRSGRGIDLVVDYFKRSIYGP